MTHPRIVHSVDALRSALGSTSPGLVPTMGALHEGHLSLIRRSAAENPLTVVSVFVNPTQFNDAADLRAYPRNLEADVEMAFDAGADIIWAPDADDIYPPDFSTTITVGKIAERWEGEARPGHFQGVATVVSILLNAVRPARSYFGEKDFQQLAVVTRMAKDLKLPGVIVGCETIRESDGLAMSSRNVRLSPEDRERASALSRALFAMRGAAKSGFADAERLRRIALDALVHVPGLTIEYLAIVDPATLEPVTALAPGVRALIAARIGGVRLIDNLELVPTMEKIAR